MNINKTGESKVAESRLGELLIVGGSLLLDYANILRCVIFSVLNLVGRRQARPQVVLLAKNANYLRASRAQAPKLRRDWRRADFHWIDVEHLVWI